VVDFHVLLSLVISVVFATMLSVLPRCRRAALRFVDRISWAALYYWRAFTGFLLVIGIAYVVLRWLRWQTPPVFVAEPHRAMGIGRRLLAFALEWFSAQGITRVELQVVAGNARAIRFYRQLGWREELVQMGLER
jgi:GNAT superfamily N-acetyltransferase